MMVNELRIGNIVLCESTKHRVVNGIKDGIHVNTIDGNINCRYNIEDIQGIPLTEEWLLKFGFEKIKDIYENEFFEYNDYIKTDLNACIWFGNNEFELTEVPVHRMQNIFFCLTGEELTIKQ